MKHVSWLLAIALCGCVEMADDEPVDDDETSEIESAVVNGSIEDNKRDTYAWVVRLSTGCQGSVIAPQWVLTSARCWTPGSPFPIVSYEAQRWDGTFYNASRTVNGAFRHHNYGGIADPHDDIMLLRLTSALADRTPIALGLGAPFAGQTGQLAAFSSQNVPLPTGKVAVFRGTVENGAPRDDREFLARGYAQLCSGDFGGGFAMYDGTKWFLTGVASLAVGGTDCGQLVDFMDVNAYAPWIRAIVPGLAAPPQGATADLLLRDGAGRLAIRYINNGTITSQTFPSYYGSGQPVPTDWSVIGTGDFDGDGRKDILWRNVNGQLGIWTLSNGAFVSDHYPSYQSQGGPVGNEWKVVGVGDFDRDGTSDLAWQQIRTGDLAIWFIRGAEFSADLAVPSFGRDWKALGVGDFDRDGYADLLLRHWDRGVRVVRVHDPHNGTQNVRDWGLLNNVWQFQGAGDFNGDGFTDILWRTNDGYLLTWLMSSTGHTHTEHPPVATWWTIVSTGGDFNGDGNADILWRCSDGTLAIWYMSGGLDFAQVYPGSLSAEQAIAGVNSFD